MLNSVNNGLNLTSYSKNKKASVFQRRLFKRCRGRDRIRRGGQLAEAQSPVVDPGRFNIAIKTALYFV